MGCPMRYPGTLRRGHINNIEHTFDPSLIVRTMTKYFFLAPLAGSSPTACGPESGMVVALGPWLSLNLKSEEELDDDEAIEDEW